MSALRPAWAKARTEQAAFLPKTPLLRRERLLDILPCPEAFLSLCDLGGIQQRNSFHFLKPLETDAPFEQNSDPHRICVFQAKKTPPQAFLRRCGAPGGTRTPDLLVRSQTLYPAELLARSALSILASFFLFVNAFLNFFGFFQQNAIRVIGEQLHRLSHRHKPGDLYLFRLGAGL